MYQTISKPETVMQAFSYCVLVYGLSMLAFPALMYSTFGFLIGMEKLSLHKYIFLASLLSNAASLNIVTAKAFSLFCEMVPEEELELLLK